MGGLAIFWKINTIRKILRVYGNNRFIGLKLFFGWNWAEIKEKIADEECELIILWDFNNDPNKGRFFKDLKCFIDAFELICSE